MNTCSFSYVTLHNNLPCRATGIERTWEYLKDEFDRQGDGLPDATVKYFETIGQGPQLFAVVDQSVYYHDQQRWSRYKSAFNIVHGTIDVPD